jgi:S1-C subfamily serine protease
VSFALCGGLPRPAVAQQADRPEDQQRRQLQVEQATRRFLLESRQTIASARKSWREGRHGDAVKELEQCLQQARKSLGEQPNAPSVDLLKTIARVQESKGSFDAAATELRRALDVQTRLTGPRSWEVLEIQSEVGRLERLGKLGGDRLAVLARLGPTVALVSAGRGSLASAICIDSRGLFLTRARPLANLWRSTTTHFEYHPQTRELIGLRTEHNRDEQLGLFVIVNPGLPDQAILPARVVRTSATDDLALLGVPARRPLAALELARGDAPEVGTEVIALNHWNAPVRSLVEEPEPIFLRACPSHIAAVRLANSRPWIFLLDTPPTPGGTEGPVLDGQGRLLGFAVQGLPGTGVAYTIPARTIKELLGKAALLAPPPALSYRDRKQEHEWVIPLWIADPKALEVTVEVAFGQGRSRRSFRATSAAGQPGQFVVRVVPVDPRAADAVDLVVGRGGGIFRYTVEDREVSVGPTKLLLSELRRVELGPEPRGLAADGRVLAGAPGGLEGLQGQSGDTIVPVDLRGASSLDVVYPPESAGPLPGELLVHSRGEVLLRERFSVRLREPLVHRGGELDVAQAPASGGPVGAPPPTRLEKDQVIALDGKVNDVAVGGRGRYLLLTLTDRRELVVFDAFRRGFAARVPLVADDVLVAASADAMLLVYPGLRIIHRWNLAKMALDRTAALPIRGEVKALALGADSAGPMLVRWVEQQDGGKFTRMNFSFIDPESLKVLACSTFRERSEHAQADHPGEVPEPGVLRLQRYSSGGDEINLRASPRSHVFGLWQSNIMPAGFVTLTLRGREPRSFQQHSDFGHLVPGQDGRTVFTGRGQRLDLEGRSLGGESTSQAKPGTPPPPGLIPSAEAAYYLAVDVPGTPHSPGVLRPNALVALHALGLDRPIGTLEVPWKEPPPAPLPTPQTQGPRRPLLDQRFPESTVTRSGNSTVTRFGNTLSQGPRRPLLDQRFHWLPAADLLVVIPPTDDQLVLRCIRLDELVQKLGGDYLFVSSPRGMDVALGRPFRHALGVMSGRGQPEFALSRGPAGLRVSPGGDLVWDRPAGGPGDEVEAVVEIRDRSGRKITEAIVLRLLASGRATR